MVDYRAYLIGDDGHFFDAVALICADDAGAKEKAKRLVDGHDVELWQRDRKIASFDRKPKIQLKLNDLAGPPSYLEVSISMAQTSDREELNDD
jgi:hypothetical protein